MKTGPRLSAWLAVLTLLILSGLAPSTTAIAAQSNAEPSSVVVTGTGRASGPADAAIVQLLIYGEGGGGQDLSATMDYRYGAMSHYADDLSSTDLTPVVNLLTKSGVKLSNIGVSIIPASPNYSPAYAQVIAKVEGSTVQRIDHLFMAISAVASDANLTFDDASLTYTSTKCADIEYAAVQNAVADGNVQATQLADALSMDLGQLREVNRFPPVYGGYTSSGNYCSDPLTVHDVQTGLVYLDRYNPGLLPEVTVSASVQLTYSLG